MNDISRLVIRHMAKCLTDLDDLDINNAVKSVIKFHFNNLKVDCENASKASVSVQEEKNYNR
jgi:hypothetical protein